MSDRQTNPRPSDGRQATDLRSFGRRRGRAPSPRQKALLTDLLPQVAINLSDPPPADARTLFDRLVSQVWLEIGFGGGEHLVWQAERKPEVGLIGCEPYEDGVVKVLSAIETQRLGNIRLHADDARAVLPWLPPASVSRAFILFPDPWPKQRHVKRRLISTPLLNALARLMHPGAELRIATDIGDYARTILMAFERQNHFIWTATSPEDWRARPADWPETKYEQKAVREGRKSYYLRFLRR